MIVVRSRKKDKYLEALHKTDLTEVFITKIAHNLMAVR